MLTSFIICLVSFLLLCSFFGYKMYTMAEMLQEVHYAESVIAKTGKNTFRALQSKLNKKTIQYVYHGVLILIENITHELVGHFKDLKARFARSKEEK